jgi:hypothetical protein
MNFIREITYRTLNGGGKNGIISFEVVFNGEEPEGKSLDTLAEVIELILRHSGRNCNRVHLNGTFPIHGNDVIFTLLGGFKSEQIETYVTLDGQYIYQWATLATGVIVHLKRPDWVGFPFYELIYDLSDPNSPEPRIPPTVNPLAHLYVNPIGDLATSRKNEVFSFIQRAKNRWNINAPGRVLKEYLFGGPQT